MSKRFYKKCERQIGPAVENAAKESCKAAEKERRLSH